MPNYRMQEKIRNREAIDISGCEKNAEGDYILKGFVDDMDYCDAIKEEWIWSIGQHISTGQILASTNVKFYSKPDYINMFLR